MCIRDRTLDLTKLCHVRRKCCEQLTGRYYITKVVIGQPAVWWNSVREAARCYASSAAAESYIINVITPASAGSKSVCDGCQNADERSVGYVYTDRCAASTDDATPRMSIKYTGITSYSVDLSKAKHIYRHNISSLHTKLVVKNYFSSNTAQNSRTFQVLSRAYPVFELFQGPLFSKTEFKHFQEFFKLRMNPVDNL